MYKIVHLPTGTQVSDRDTDDDYNPDGNWDPNCPRIPPLLYFNTDSDAKTFIEDVTFVLYKDGVDWIPLIALAGVYYADADIIPKYHLEVVECTK